MNFEKTTKDFMNDFGAHLTKNKNGRTSLPFLGLLDPLQKLAVDLLLSAFARLDGILQIGKIAEAHQFAFEFERCHPFAGTAVIGYAATAAGVGGDQPVAGDAADLRAVDIARLFAPFGIGVYADAIVAHAQIAIGQAVGGLVYGVSAIASTVPKRNGTFSACSTLVRAANNHQFAETTADQIFFGW